MESGSSKVNHQDLVGDEEEIIEEEIRGKIVLTSDGKYYVELTDEKEQHLELDLKKFEANFLEETDGTKTLIFENKGERDKLILEKAHARMEAALWRRNALKKNKTIEGQQLIVDEEVVIGEGGEQILIDDEMAETADGGGNSQESVKSHGIRVYGSCECKCQECGQTFANMARLERHLAVHQQFGAFLCPLCSKSYKYEYNLFYHWRRTCKDMNDLLSYEERKIIEINALRQLVEEIAQKKASIGPLELMEESTSSYCNSGQADYSRGNTITNHFSQITQQNLFDGKIVLCRICNLSVYQKHLPMHLMIHRGQREVDERSVGGAFFCDLCGLMFKTHGNLIVHWRTNCFGIMENLPEDCCDFAMDDLGLKRMVNDLLKKKSMEELDLSVYAEKEGENIDNETTIIPDFLDEDWAASEGIIFADEFLETTMGGEGTLMMADDGKVVTRMVPTGSHQQHRHLQQPTSSAELIGPTQQILPIPGVPGTYQLAAPSFHTIREGGDGEEKATRWYPHQCNECLRTFSSLPRLEKHMAGAHYSVGSHHCLFCGNRFKYEYNLLFHLRHVCPYSLELLPTEARQQMEAADLKKMVRNIASRGDFHLLDYHPPATTSATGMEEIGQIREDGIMDDQQQQQGMKTEIAHKSELGDSVIRRQMMNKIIQQHTPKHTHSSNQPNNILLPPVLLQSLQRPDLPEGCQCPICSVTFYGIKILARHLKAAHPNESTIWEKTLRALNVVDRRGNAENANAPKLRPSRLASAKSASRKRKTAREEEDNEEMPPRLEIQHNLQQEEEEERH